MILYSKDWWGVPLILRAYGSAFPRVLPPVLFSGALTAGIVWGGHAETVAAMWIHPYSYSIFAAILSFALVFRAQYAYSRYWEARTNLQQMTARMTDAAALILAFDRHTLPPDDPMALVASAHFTSLVIHLCSLLHAVMCQGLRRDPCLANIVAHSVKEPPVDVGQLARGGSLGLGTSGNMVGRSRPQDLFVLRGSAPALAQYNAAQPLAVIGGISTGEWSALACMTGNEQTIAWPSSSRGRTKRFAASVNISCCSVHPAYMDRPHLVAAWLQELLVRRKVDGGLAVASPILARVYQLLSESMSGYEQCRKMADTPFPFPWAQFMIVVLILFTISFPLLVVGFVRNHLLAVFLTAITVATYWCTSEVAREIEDPFFNEPNSLPLALTQHQVNRLLQALASASRPLSNIEAHPPDGVHPHSPHIVVVGPPGVGASRISPNPFAASLGAVRLKDPAAPGAAGARSPRAPGSPTSPRWGHPAAAGRRSAPGAPQLPSAFAGGGAHSGADPAASAAPAP